MLCTVHDVAQRSPEWYALRVGLLTGSAANAVIQERKRGSGELEARRTLRKRLVCERLTRRTIESDYKSRPMQRGSELEPEAFRAYEAVTGRIVRRVGFLSHPTLRAGCSPDGCIGKWEGGLELKAPNSTTHLEYLQAGVLPEDYRGQVLHALWLTGAAWWDFCSYDPRFDPGLDFFRVRTRREDVDLQAYELAVTLFLADVDREVEALRARGQEAAA